MTSSLLPHSHPTGGLDPATLRVELRSHRRGILAPRRGRRPQRGQHRRPATHPLRREQGPHGRHPQARRRRVRAGRERQDQVHAAASRGVAGTRGGDRRADGRKSFVARRIVGQVRRRGGQRGRADAAAGGVRGGTGRGGAGAGPAGREPGG